MSRISHLNTHVLKEKRLPLFGGRRSFGFYVFTPYDYLPPGTPVVVVVVVVVQLLIIFNADK
jgi:hypothetical protein